MPSFKPFRMDIQQGNVVTSKMMLQLKPGMTKSQVRFIMGTPLIQDGFHPDRWDYFYQMRKGGKIVEQRRVIMDFENDALLRVRGDVIPAGTGEAVAEPEAVTPYKSKKSEKKKGLLDRLQFWKDDEDVDKPQAAPKDLIAPAAGTPASDAPATEGAVIEDPVRSPAAAPATQQPLEVEQTPAAPTEPSPPALEGETAPSVAPAEQPPSPEKPTVKPMLMPTEPTPAPEMGPIDAPEPAPVMPPADTPPAVEPMPAPEPEPVVTPPPEVQQPASKSQPAPKATSKPVQKIEPEDDLPPEEDPGYFERMLEKIGF